MRYVNKIEEVKELSVNEREELKQVTRRFPFRANEYYLKLIDWGNPSDPIRKIIIPDRQELIRWGSWDASSEASYTVLPGIEHKYEQTILVLASPVCGGICRYCFRKRLFSKEVKTEIARPEDVERYVKSHPEVTNVLLSGGDPLMLSNRRLSDFLRRLVKIEHLRFIRIGTKMPAFNPYRILEDPELLELLKDTAHKKMLYIVMDFNHPKEVTPQAAEAVRMLRATGAELLNQTPLIKGLNDDPETLSNLFAEMTSLGVSPYYVFQNRPAFGNKVYSVPIERGYRIIEEAKAQCSGVSKRIRFVMSHATGKIEVLGVYRGTTIFRYHEAADPANAGRIMVFPSNPEALWLDDYIQVDQRIGQANEQVFSEN